MVNPHFWDLASDALERLEELQRQRETIDAETLKLEQFIAATANMLPDEAKSLVMQRMANLQELSRVREYGLTESTRMALKANAGDWLTISNVRDQLLRWGFDFSAYTSNPLASISSVLRRMKSEDVETTTTDGVAAYRWRQQEPSLANAFAAITSVAAPPAPPTYRPTPTMDTRKRKT